MKKWFFNHRAAIAGLAIVCSLGFMGIARADETTSSSSSSSSTTTDSSSSSSSSTDTSSASAVVASSAEAGFGTILSLIPMLIVTVLSAIIWVIGKLIVIVIGILIVPILGYNNFAHSNVISIGWPLVRDVVNMLFILYLLYIAVRTILGQEHHWQEQIIKLFIAAVAVNFSRTICLLIIDFGQVVMFTFVDAIRDIAAGNFVNLFQISDFLSVSWSNASGNAGLNAIGYLGAAYAILIFMSMVLAVLLLMAVIFIYRIVILWILIIMAPAAFFAMAMGAGFAGEWKRKFTGAVLLGPSLAFFLWLALAAASSGPIATSEQFATLSDPDTEGDFDFGIGNEIFQVDKLLSLFIALVIIMAGFQVSSQFAGQLGGVAADYVNEKTAKNWIKGFAAAPATIGYRVGREAARQIDRRTGISEHVGERVIEASNSFRNIPLVGAPLARSIAAAGSSFEHMGEESTKEARKGAVDRVKHMSTFEKANMVQNMASKDFKMPNQLALQDEYKQLYVDWTTSKNFRNDTESAYKERLKKENPSLTAAQVDARAAKFTDDMNKKTMDFFSDEKNERALIDDDAKKGALLKMRTGNLQHLSAKARTDVITDEKFNPNDLSAGALRDKDILDRLSKKQTRVYTDNKGNRVTETVLDNVMRGVGVSQKVKDALPGLVSQHIDAKDGAGNRIVTQEQLTAAMRGGFIKIDDATLGGKMAADPAIADSVAKAAVAAGVDLGAAKAKLAGNPTAQTAFVDGAARHLETERSAAKSTEKRLDIADKIHNLNGNTAQYVSAVESERPSAKTDAARAAIDSRVFNITNNLDQAFGYTSVTPAGGGPAVVKFKDVGEGGKQNARESFAQTVKNDITVVNKIVGVRGNDLDFTSASSDMHKVLTDNKTGLTAKDLDAIAEKVRVSTDAAYRAQVKAALQTISQTMDSASTARGGDPRLMDLKNRSDAIVTLL